MLVITNFNCFQFGARGKRSLSRCGPTHPELICTSIAPSLSCWVCLMPAFLPAALSAWNVLLGYLGGNSLIPQARPTRSLPPPPSPFSAPLFPRASSPPKLPYRWPAVVTDHCSPRCSSSLGKGPTPGPWGIRTPRRGPGTEQPASNAECWRNKHSGPKL